jgi:hypothetical protein
MRRFFAMSLLWIAAGSLVFPDIVSAQETSGIARVLFLPAQDGVLIALRIGQIIGTLLALGAVAFLIFSAIKFNETADQALESEQWKKKMIISGTAAGGCIFLVVIFTIIFSVFAGRVQEEIVGPTGAEVVGRGEGLAGKGAQGQRIVSHYPQKNEKNIPRNTAIFITFAEAIHKESVIEQTNKMKRAVIRIQETGASGAPALDASAEFDPTNTTIRLIPNPMLGKQNKRTRYSITVTTLVQKESGEQLLAKPYVWEFEVSGVIDNTPPFIESALPLLQAPDRKELTAINSLIQITFSEAVDPSIVTKDKIEIIDAKTSKKIPGGLILGNNYRTVTFYAKEKCEKNTCAENVFCLPKDLQIKVTAKAADLSATPNPQSPNRAKFPYTGIVDTCGNSFDGGGENGVQKNGKAEGPKTDNYWWFFTTSAQKDTDIPQILSVHPGRDAIGVTLTTPVDMLFSRFMDITSFTNWSVTLGKDVQDIDYWTAATHDIVKRRTILRINHDPFKKDTFYTPQVKSHTKDIYQNCFNASTGPDK